MLAKIWWAEGLESAISRAFIDKHAGNSLETFQLLERSFFGLDLLAGRILVGKFFTQVWAIWSPRARVDPFQSLYRWIFSGV